MFKILQFGGKLFRASLVMALAAALTTGAAAAQASSPTLGFTSADTETTNGTAALSLTLILPGGHFISAMQFDIETDGVALESIDTGSDLDDFEVDSRVIASGATRVLAYAESGKLSPKTYVALFTLNVATTGEGTVTISNVIGAGDSDFGNDANLQLGTATHGVTLTLVGDATGDFQVDLSDVSQEIDAVFDSNEPGADVYPWESPDGQVDIRDLLVLVRAVLAGEWPDGSPLNLDAAGKNGSSGSAIAKATGSSDAARLDLKEGILTLDPSVPVKVLMVTLHGGAQTSFSTDPAFGGTAVRGTHVASGALRVIFYRMDGEPLFFEGGALGLVAGDVYRLEAEAVSPEGRPIPIDAGITSVSAATDPELPAGVHLTQNYPNPFNPTTQFELELPETQQVEISVFNIFGKRVATLHSGILSAGTQTFRLDGSGLSSGQYYYRAQGERFQAIRAMTLMK